MPAKRQVTVSIIIKALNEDRHIAAAIESAMAALIEVDGEIILADGGSDDRTIEIAGKYPVTIVQLNRINDRCCGSGAQLGFQYSNGRYLLLMDGDMRLHKGFLPTALDFLDQNPHLAGVGGNIVERSISNLEYEQRKKRFDPDRRPGRVTRLNCSGVYRRSSIESIGYLTDRNLHGAEEFDLSARLHARGWGLARIDYPAVDHYGHTGSAYRLLFRRMATRYSFAPGELLRAAIGRPHFWFIVGKEHIWLLFGGVIAWWAALVLTPLVLTGWRAALAGSLLFLLPFGVMSLRYRSISRGLYAVTAWNVYTVSFFPGFVRSRISPLSWIESTVLKNSGGAKADAVGAASHSPLQSNPAILCQ
jgi:glycosyltransferase involved in cell wall biosynthesis